MFTRHIPRTGNSVGNNTHSGATRAGAVVGIITLTAGLSLAMAAPASAADVASSYAKAQFLSGSLLGTDLANVAELGPAEARNNGQQSLQTSKDPLDASVLKTIDVDAANGIQTDLGSIIDAGAVSQYAQADKDGKSMASAGAIGDDGAIGVGSVGTGSAGDLNVDLDSLLDTQFGQAITDLKLSLDAVSAQAVGDLDKATGTYRLDGATLTFTSPAIKDLNSRVASSLAVIDTTLANLGKADGALGSAVNGVLNPVLAPTGSSANVTVSVTSDVDAAVQKLLKSEYGNDAVHFNLETGEVSVDLEALQGGSLNNLPVNTELLSDAVVNQVLTGITGTVSTLADQIVATVTSSLHNAQVDVHADLDLLTDPPAAVNNVCNPVQVPIIGDVPIVGGVLGGLLGGGSGGTTKGITGYTTQTVCNLVDSVLPALHSTVKLDISATVDQLLKGVAAQATGEVSLLDGAITAPIDVQAIIGDLGSALTDNLFDPDGLISQVTDNLSNTLVKPAVTGLLGDSGVGTALKDILSVRVNLQELTLASQQGLAVASGQFFTETAVRITALRGVGSTGLATVNVAAATVGPNISTIVTPPGCTTNCGPGGNPDPCVTNCAGGPGTGTVGTAASRLAMTGVGIGALIAIILALLAAGAFLAREGYRRNHPTPSLRA